MSETFTVDPGLITRAVSRLAGRRTITRWRRPANIDALACAWIDETTNLAMIDITPGLPASRLLETLAHEAAHVRLGHCRKSDHAKEPPASIRYRAEVVNYLAYRPIEPEADRQAAQWLKWAESHCSEYNQPTAFERKLEALAHWFEPEIERMITQAAKSAIAQFTR